MLIVFDLTKVIYDVNCCDSVSDVLGPSYSYELCATTNRFQNSKIAFKYCKPDDIQVKNKSNFVTNQ